MRISTSVFYCFFSVRSDASAFGDVESGVEDASTGQPRREGNVFSKEVTESEKDIIQQRVALQQKQFAEFERRDKERKFKKVVSMYDYLSTDELEEMLKDCNNDEVKSTADPPIGAARSPILPLSLAPNLLIGGDRGAPHAKRLFAVHSTRHCPQICPRSRKSTKQDELRANGGVSAAAQEAL